MIGPMDICVDLFAGGGGTSCGAGMDAPGDNSGDRKGGAGMTFTERFRLQGPAKGGGWREMAAADSREQLEKIRKRLMFPELYRVIDTQEECKDDR